LEYLPPPSGAARTEADSGSPVKKIVMNKRGAWVLKASRFLQDHLILLLIVAYALGAFWPGPGRQARGLSIGHVTLFREQVKLSLPVLTLASLLVSASLGVNLVDLSGLARRPAPLLAGIAANSLIPIAYLRGVTVIMRPWHSPDEVQNILVGLALVASMPIAGTSTAWSQNADGDLALSLGLVLASTLLSPLTTPLALRTIGLMATGDYAEDLRDLATGGAGLLLALAVILPTLLGVALRKVAGEYRIAAARPALKLINTSVMLFLSYSTASDSIPQAIAAPDTDFLIAMLLAVVGSCVVTFVAGWAIARWLGVGRNQRTSLMFGLGTNNNGTGLVMASLALADHPRVILPIIAYNLIQQLVAGVVSRITVSDPIRLGDDWRGRQAEARVRNRR